MSVGGHDARPDAFRDALFAARDRAWTTAETSTHGFELAGRRIRCHFAGATAATAILPALAHHVPIDDGAAELDVYVWSGDETGVDAPPVPWPTAPASAWQCDTPAHFGLFLPILDSLLWLDRANRRAIYWTPSARRIPLVERGSPLLLLWGAWLADFGVHLVHAASVCGPRGAALLLGTGGSGKSTTALTCLDTSLGYLGDDYCLFTVDPTPTVFSLYASGKVHRADRRFHPHLEPAYAGENDEKILYQLAGPLGARLAHEAPVAALVSMRVGADGRTRLDRISAMQATRAVAPNSLLQVRVGIKSTLTLRALAQLAQRVECYAMTAGTPREAVARTLVEFLGA